MPRQYKRFPRSVLFAHAAQLHSDLEYWMNETSAQIKKSEDLGYDTLTGRLHARYHRLEEAWKSAGEVRQELFDVS